jgi:PAS domain S-box-containing protein
MKTGLSPFLDGRYFWIFAMSAWGMMVVFSWAWNCYFAAQSMTSLIESKVRAAHEKDVVYRLWASRHGGLYVPISDQTAPDPYLAHLSDRDIETTDGRMLTLVNPAHMTRLAQEMGQEAYGLRCRITSLTPLSPENMPDAWETRALLAFENGAEEMISKDLIEGQPLLRLMRPFRTEVSCLRCHGQQGFKEDDIQGGVAVSVSLAPYHAALTLQRTVITLAHALIGGFGLIGIWVGGRRLGGQRQQLVQQTELLRSLEDRYRLAIDCNRAAVWEWNVPEGTMEVPDRWFAIRGLPPKGPVCPIEEWERGIHPEDLPWVMSEVQKHFGGETDDFVAEYRVRHADGSWRWVLDRAVAQRDDQGQIVRMVGSEEDVTRRKQAERALEGSLARFRSLTEMSMVGIWATDAEGNNTYLSPRCVELGGIAPELARGLGWVSAVHPEDRERVSSEWKQASQQTRPFVSEFRFLHHDGRVVWVLSQAMPVTQGDGEIVEWIGSVSDLTDLKRTEQDLRENEQRNRAMLSAMPDLIFVCDREGIYLDCLVADPNDLLASPQEFLGRSLRDYHTKEDAERILAAFQQVLADRRLQIVEYELELAKDRSWFETRITAIDDQRVLCLVRNVTERKIAERSLQQQQEQLEHLVAERTASLQQEIQKHQETLEALSHSEAYNRALVAAIPDLIFVIDRQGYFLDYHARDDDELLFLPEEFLGRRYQEVLPSSIAEQLNGAVEGLFTSDRKQRFEYRLQVADQELSFETLLTKLDDDRVMMIAHNITERVEAARKLQEANQRLEQEIARCNELAEQAEAANQAKTRFTANTSHEIRSPLNAVYGFAQLLERDPSLTPKQHEYTQTILRSVQHLLHLLNQVLDLSKIEAGKTELHMEDFNLDSFLADSITVFRHAADAKNLGLVVDRDPNLPNRLHSDAGKLREIVVNLLANAVKFTTEGQIVLRVRRSVGTDQAATSRLVFEVQDTGPGLSKEEQAYVFQPYAQTTLGAQAGGIGLGLPLSRELAQLMGGTLGVASRLGSGTTFRLEVPLQEALDACVHERGQRHAIKVDPASGPWRILIADDKPDNLNILKCLLSPMGFELREASDGAEAWEVFQQWKPHAALLDMRMPKMDGYEVARRIKASSDGRKTLVVAITASVFEDARERSRDAGIDCYLPKPFETNKLLDFLANGLDLSYVYGEELSEGSPDLAETSISETVYRPSAGMIRAFDQALVSVDYERIMDLIQEVKQADKRAGEILTSMAENFEYERLSRWLHRAELN